MTLTAKELREKIQRVENDLNKLAEEGNLQGINALSSYKEYLQDELRIAEQSERANGNK
jgi:hypothetical protein